MNSVLEYLEERKVVYKLEGKEAIITCPSCNKPKLSINIDTEVYQCWHCQALDPTSVTAKGHISKLKEMFGDVLPLTQIVKPQKKKTDFTSMVDYYHECIWNDSRALKYLRKLRGFNEDVIKAEKLGVVNKSNIDWISIPVFEEGIPVLIKYRQIPPGNPALDKYKREEGGKSALFNADCLKIYNEVIICEGEFDAITLKHKGFPNVVSPTAGASALLPEWYDQLVLKDKIYLILDPDQVGQAAAKNVWATRLGLNKCFNVLLPTVDGQKEDVNSFFLTHTKEDFEFLLAKAERFPVDGIVSLEEAAYEMYDKANSEEMEIFPTPWASLNTCLGGGLKRTELVVIGAAAGIGKTTMAMQLLYHFAKELKTPAFMCCLEMSTVALLTKVIQLEFGIPIEEVDYSNALIYANNLKDIPLYLGYKPGLNIKTYVETCRVARDRFGCGIVCLDNLQFMVRSKDETDYGIATRALKDMAMELKIITLLISQPRKLQAGDSMTYEVLKGSSALSQDPDKIILLDRKRKEGKESTGSFSPKTQVTVDKARDAPGGRSQLYYRGELARFDEREIE